MRTFIILLWGVFICVWYTGCGGLGVRSNATNLALHKNAVASSSEKAHPHSGNVNYIAAYAVDGNMETRWASDFRDDPDRDVAWIYVDLGLKTEVRIVKIEWDESYAEEFNIEVSDDAETWTVVSVVKGNVDQGTLNFEEQHSLIKLDKPVSARYVKVDCKKRSTRWGYSIYELEIY
jgi:hypothetical protein